MLPQEDRGLGAVVSGVPSFLDNLLGSIFGGNRSAAPAPAPNTKDNARPNNRSSGAGTAGSRPSGGGARPPVTYDYPDRDDQRD